MNRFGVRMMGIGWMSLLLSSATWCAGEAVAEGRPRSWPGIPSAGGGARWVQNLGQWPEGIQFVAQLPGMVARAEKGALGFELHGGENGSYLRMVFAGASPDASWEGSEPLEGMHHFFLGKDPNHWVRNAGSFAELWLTDLYPGIDLALRVKEGRLKYDLFVAPGADLGQVRLQCEGLDGFSRAGGEGLELVTALGSIVQVPGAAWEVLPSGAQREVLCTWRVEDDAVLVVDCPERDSSLPLVIDPELTWSTYLGSSTYLANGDFGGDVDVSTEGDVVMVGRTDGLNFPQSPGAFQRPGGDNISAFATKLRGLDGALIFSSVFGGLGGEQATGVGFDAAGKVTVVGRTEADDFPVTPGAYDTVRGQGNDAAFVAQFTALGDDLVFSTYLEGELSGGQAFEVESDSQGRCIVGGIAFGGDFPTTPGAFEETAIGVACFVVRLNVTGSALEWSTFLGGGGLEEFWDLALGPDEMVTVVGRTFSQDFPTTPDAFMPTPPDNNTHHGFVARLSAEGDALVWGSYLGGTDDTTARGVDVDAFGTVLVTGVTEADDFPITPGAFMENVPAEFGGSFVTRFTPDGTDVIFSTYFGSAHGTSSFDIDVDASGICSFSGITTDLGLPITPGAFDTDPDGIGTTLFVARFSPAGDRLFYSTYLGGPNGEGSRGIALTDGGRVTLGGDCNAPGGYPTTPDAPFPNFLGGQTDVIVTTFDLLLEGVREYGRSTPACLGTLRIGVTRMPVQGDPDFALYCSGAPPDALGWLLVSEGPARFGQTDASQAISWVDGSRIIHKLPVHSDVFGYAETTYRLLGESAGRQLYFQYVFTNPPACAGSGERSASFALEVTVQE